MMHGTMCLKKKRVGLVSISFGGQGKGVYTVWVKTYNCRGEFRRLFVVYVLYLYVFY